MITYVMNDLFRSPAKTLVNTVNTEGVMGKGIAKQFKEIYPDMFTDYQHLCENNQFQIGQLWLYKTPHKWILNFPTKIHWRYKSKIEYIEKGLKTFVKNYAKLGITSISFPPLGCGNGELDWNIDVKPIMMKYLNTLPIDIFIHLYKKDPCKPEHLDINQIQTWLRSEPRSLAFTEVWEDIEGLVNSKRTFETIDSRIPFHIKLETQSNNEEGLEIQEMEENIFVSKEDLLSLWQQIRNSGFCIEPTMPGDLARNAPFIIGVLTHLPYIKPFTYVPTKNNYPIGLQLYSIGQPDTELFSSNPKSVELVST